jgi:hypothetical protein
MRQRIGPPTEHGRPYQPSLLRGRAKRVHERCAPSSVPLDTEQDRPAATCTWLGGPCSLLHAGLHPCPRDPYGPGGGLGGLVDSEEAAEMRDRILGCL